MVARVLAVAVLAVFAVVAMAAPAAPRASPWRALAQGQFDGDALRSLQNSGYTVFPAKVVWYSVDSVAPPRGPRPTVFYVNNPLTIYGGIAIPVARPAAAGSTSDVFQMDGDSAIALYGTTPPAITYYSFTMNEFSRYRPDTGKYFETNSSIALSVNNENIGTRKGLMFEDSFVLIVAAKFSAVQQAKDFFLKQGIPARSINTILIPHRFTKQSANPAPMLNLLTRLTYRTQAEKDIVVAYTKRNPQPLKALYFKGPGVMGDVQDSDLAKWEDLLRDDRSEFAGNTAAGLQMLGGRVLQHYAGLGYRVTDQAGEVLRHIDPDIVCRDAWTSCNYDAPDSAYGNFYCEAPAPAGEEPKRCTGIMPDDNVRAVVVGIDHHRFGNDELMTYFSYAVTRAKDLQGVTALADLDLRGSAAPFLPDLPNPQDFFVFTVARQCSGDPYCMEVPFEDSSAGPGVPKFGLIEISTRAYLDKVTGTAPNPANLMPAQLYWLKK